MFAGWGSRVARLRWSVLIVTLVTVIGAGVWGMGVFGQLTEGGYADPSSESARAADVVAAAVGGQGGDVIAIYTPADGLKLDSVTLTKRITNRLAALPKASVTSAVSYWDKKNPAYAAKDKSSAVAIITLAGEDDAAKLDAYSQVANAFTVDGATVQLAGGIPLAHTSNERSTDDLGSAELISMPIVLILLLFIFGSLIAASLPVIVGGCAVLGSLGVLHAVSLGHDVNSFAVNVASLLGLGMAIDYGLFMVGRFREEQAAGHDPAEAVRRTVATAGRTVVFSATLLMTALAGLLLFPQGFLKSLAYGGLAAVFLAMLLSLTLLPAILAILGPRVDRLPVRLPFGRGSGSGWQKVASFVLRRPVLVAIPILAGLIVLALPIAGVRFGENDERVLPAGDPSRVAVETLKTSYPQFSGDGVQVVLRGPAAPAFAAQLAKVPGVASVNPAGSGTDVTVYNAALKSTDSFSSSARQVVSDIRALPAPAGTEVLVGGVTARNVDSLKAIGDQLPLMIGLLTGATLLLMFLAFGSILLPIKAVVMSALSLSATFGLLVWLFQEGHGSGLLNVTPAPLEAGIVVLMAAVVFGLSTDYEVFLLSRMVEARTKGASTAAAVTTGLTRTGRVISAAALLLIVVTGAFALSTVTTMRFVGVGMIIALVLDATVVRMLLVPAVLALLGDAAWWAPGPLKRLQERAGLAEHAGEDSFTVADPETEVLRYDEAALHLAKSSAAALAAGPAAVLSAGPTALADSTDAAGSLVLTESDDRDWSDDPHSPDASDSAAHPHGLDGSDSTGAPPSFGGSGDATSILPAIRDDEDSLVTAPDETSILIWDPEDDLAPDPTETDAPPETPKSSETSDEAIVSGQLTSAVTDQTQILPVITPSATPSESATPAPAAHDDDADSQDPLSQDQPPSQDQLSQESPSSQDEPSQDSASETQSQDAESQEPTTPIPAEPDEDEAVPAQSGSGNDATASDHAEDSFNPWVKAPVSDTASPSLACSGAYDVTQVMPIYQAARRFASLDRTSPTTDTSPTSETSPTTGTSLITDTGPTTNQDATTPLETTSAEVTLDETAEPAPEAELKDKSEPEAGTTPETPTDPETLPDPHATADPQASTDPQATADPQATSEPHATAEPEPLAEAETESEAELQTEPEPEPEPEPEAATTAGPGTKAAEPLDSEAIWAQVEATLAAGAEAVAADYTQEPQAQDPTDTDRSQDPESQDPPSAEPNGTGQDQDQDPATVGADLANRVQGPAIPVLDSTEPETAEVATTAEAAEVEATAEAAEAEAAEAEAAEAEVEAAAADVTADDVAEADTPTAETEADADLEAAAAAEVPAAAAEAAVTDAAVTADAEDTAEAGADAEVAAAAAAVAGGIPAEVADAFGWMSDPRIAGIVGGDDAGGEQAGESDFTWLAATAALPTLSAPAVASAETAESLEVPASRVSRPATLGDFPARPRRAKVASVEESAPTAEIADSGTELASDGTAAVDGSSSEAVGGAVPGAVGANAADATTADEPAEVKADSGRVEGAVIDQEVSEEAGDATAAEPAETETGAEAAKPAEAVEPAEAEAAAAEAAEVDSAAAREAVRETAARAGSEAWGREPGHRGRPETLGEWLHGDEQRPRTLDDVAPVSSVPGRRPQTLDEWLHGSPSQARPQSLDDWLAADNRPVSSAGPRPESLGDLPGSGKGRRPSTLADHTPDPNRGRRANGGPAHTDRPAGGDRPTNGDRPANGDRPTNSDHAGGGERPMNGGPNPAERQAERETDPDPTGS